MELLKRVMLVDAFFHFTWPSLLKTCIKVAMLPCIAENLMNYNTAWYTVNEWVGNCVHHFCLSMPCILHVYPSMPFYVACLSMPCSYITCLSMPFYVACLSMPYYVACLYPCHVHLSCLSIPCVMLFIHAYDGCFSMMPVYQYQMHLSCLAIWWLFIQAGSASDVNGALFHHTEATCTGMPCPPYDPQKELTCTICTK